MKLMIDVYMDYVIIEGRRVDRPSHIARSIWISQWERINKTV
jgi:hypothetical protein